MLRPCFQDCISGSASSAAAKTFCMKIVYPLSEILFILCQINLSRCNCVAKFSLVGNGKFSFLGDFYFWILLLEK